MQNSYIEIIQKESKIHSYYIDAFTQYSKRYNATIYIFSESFKDEDIQKEIYFSSIWIFLRTYNSESELISMLIEIQKESIIDYISTFSEWNILLANSLKKKLWYAISDMPELFRDKKLQRESLLAYNPNITVRYIDSDKDIVTFDSISQRVWFPCMLKPKSGQESAWVQKINSVNDLWDIGKIASWVLIEEYIDGAMFSIDYFVDKDQEFSKNFPVQVPLASDVDIDDFFNLSRIISNETHHSLELERLYWFIRENILACGIRNTFVHHEFKLTTTGRLKTIELNGRIGWYRLEMYNEAYNYNLLDAIHSVDNISPPESNIASIALYPTTLWILKEYNHLLLEEIQNLPSFSSVRILPEKYKGKEVWLTRDGFWKLWTIKLKSKNLWQFQSDYNFIIENYKNLLILV